MIWLFLKLFYSFAKIGLFGFGGDYAMISLIQGEVVTSHRWLTSSQFADVIAISQVTPGPVGINSATYVGYASVVNAGYAEMWGWLGSFIATLGIVFPSFLLMFLVLKMLMKYSKFPIMELICTLLRPAIIGVVGGAALLLMNKENFSSPNECPWDFWISVFLFVSAFVGITRFKVSPAFMIFLCGMAGWLLF